MTTSARRVFGEALRNRIARGALTVSLSALFALALIGVFASERSAASESRSRTARMVSAGYTTLIIQAAENPAERFTWHDCLGMDAVYGTLAVLGLREPEATRLWSPRGLQLPARDVIGDVSSYLAVTDPDPTRDLSGIGAIFDNDAASARPLDTLNTHYPVKLVTDDDTATIAKVANASLTSIGDGLSGNALVIAPPIGEISTCVVLTELEARSSVLDVAQRTFSPSANYSARWALANADRFDGPRAAYEQRPSRFYWLAATATLVLVWLFGLRILRNEVAVYSVAGLVRTRLSLIVLFDLLIIVALATAITAAYILAAWVWAHHRLDSGYTLFTADLRVGLLAAARTWTAATLCAGVFGWLTSTRIGNRTLDALKDGI